MQPIKSEIPAYKSVLLNKRSEFPTKYQHKNKFYAANQKRDTCLQICPPKQEI